MGNEGGQYMQNGATHENWSGSDGYDQLKAGGRIDSFLEGFGIDAGTGSEEFERIKQ